MPGRDGTGPTKGSRGPRDGRGRGGGNRSGPGIGPRKGGGKGNC